MKITLEISDEILTEVFKQAHCRYWCSGLVFNSKTMTGTVTESNDDNTVNVIDRKSIKNGLTLLATAHGRVFGKLLLNDIDGPMADVVLQFCAGLTWTDPSGRVVAKYG